MKRKLFLVRWRRRMSPRRLAWRKRFRGTFEDFIEVIRKAVVGWAEAEGKPIAPSLEEQG